MIRIKLQHLAKAKHTTYAAKLRLGAVAILLLVLIATTATLHSIQNRPERSTASFCTYLKANESPDDWKAEVQYYKELEARAPSGVYEQTKTIRQNYEKMIKKPEAAIALDLSIAGTGNQFNDWVKKNCYPDDTPALQQWMKDYRKSQDQPNSQSI